MSTGGSERLSALTAHFTSCDADDALPPRLLPQDEELSRILHEMIEISRIADLASQTHRFLPKPFGVQFPALPDRTCSNKNSDR